MRKLMTMTMMNTASTISAYSACCTTVMITISPDTHTT